MYYEQFNNIIPDLEYKALQDYIIHDFSCNISSFISNNKGNVIKYLENNNLELIKIEIERNYNGLKDFRLFSRKRKNNGGILK